jgi:mannose-6-phosphate isomerase-like protein (cupin superfamily)
MLQRMQAIVACGGTPALSDYEQLPSISIDYAIMEKTRRAVLLPAEFGWSDIGSWKALYDHSAKDQAGNMLVGDVITRHTHGCLILGGERLVTANRVEGLAVIDTADALFVGDLDTSREVKEIVALLEERRRPESRHHREVARQWGYSRLLERAAGYRILRLALHPEAIWHHENKKGGCIRLTVAAGRGRLVGGSRERRLGTGDTLALAAGESMAIQNTGDRPLVMIQVEISVEKGS